MLLVSDLACCSFVRLFDDIFCARGCPWAGVGGSDGTGFSNRSFDVVLTGGAGATGVASKRLGLACVIFEACGVAIDAEAGSSFSDKPFMYCDISLAMLCCRKSSFRCRGDWGVAGALGDACMRLSGESCGVSSAGTGFRTGETGKGTLAAALGDCSTCDCLLGEGVLGRGGGSMLPRIVPRARFSTSSEGEFSLFENERLGCGD